MPVSEHSTNLVFPTDREIRLTRLLRAPRELVWKAWTTPELLVKWWGPRGFTTTTSVIDFKPGGAWRFIMHGPDGRDYHNRIVFLDVLAPERIVYKHAGDIETEPVNFQTNVTFAAVGPRGGHTLVTLGMLFPSRNARDFVLREYGAGEGGKQTLARLDECVGQMAGAPSGAAVTKITLPSDTELTMTRDFDAPRTLVFDAWTRPELLRRWWGPPGWTLEVCDMDLRVGGEWRQVMRGPRGMQITMRGVYQELVRPERVVYTQIMEGCDGQGASEAIGTAVFAERNGRTTLAATVRYPSKEVRDSVLKHGTSEEGMDVIFSRLDAVIAEGVLAS